MIPILFRSLALTLLTELPLAAGMGLRDRRKLETVLLMNLATNPPAVFFLTLVRKFWTPDARKPFSTAAPRWCGILFSRLLQGSFSPASWPFPERRSTL